jgi:triacylglycerol lipase
VCWRVGSRATPERRTLGLGLAPTPATVSATLSTQPPVLLVHGLWDSRARIDPLARGLRARGLPHVHSFDLEPNDGRASIAALADQIRAQADALLERLGAPRLDLVGFSMGALASRYYLQRCGGRDRVRRFVSISGPHAGTWTAYALPFEGARQMRPGSAFLRALDADEQPFGAVEVHCLYTSLDLMIVPAISSVLREAKSIHRLRVPLHRWMIQDPAVLDRVGRILLE